MRSSARRRLNMTLYIPYNYPFVLDEATSRFISQYIDYEDMDGNTWEMNEKGIEVPELSSDN